jgi:hypothetical protein
VSLVKAENRNPKEERKANVDSNNQDAEEEKEEGFPDS